MDIFDDVIVYEDIISWENRKDDVYHVTGVDNRGVRFRTKVFDSWHHARMINVYRGNIWLVRDGKRKKIQTISN